MGGELADVLGLVRRIYDAVLWPQAWAEILEEIAYAHGAMAAALFYLEERHSELAAGISAWTGFWNSERGCRYRRQIASDDLAFRLLSKSKPQTIITSDAISLRDRLKLTRFARDMWCEFGVQSLAAARLSERGAWQDFLTLQFDARHGPMGAAEQASLQVLLPHVAKALVISRPMALLEQRFGAILDVLHRFHVGVMILTKLGTMAVANEEARRVLDEKDGLVLDGLRVLSAERESDRARLQRAIDQLSATARAGGLAEQAVLSIPRRSGRAPYLVELAPLTDSTGDIARSFVGAIVYIVDPSSPRRPSTRGMRELYSLPPAEDQTCELLVQGHENGQIAEIRGVSTETVKSQVQSLLRKTRVSNRASLVRLALSVNLPVDSGDRASAAVPRGLETLLVGAGVWLALYFDEAVSLFSLIDLA